MADLGGLRPYLQVPLFGKNYARKLISLFGQSSVVALWPLTDPSGTTITDVSGNGRNGTYTGPTLANAPGPRGNKNVPLFDGVNDYGSLYSASLNSGFNSSEGTLLAWLKVYNAAVYTDTTYDRAIVIGADGNNYVSLHKDQTANYLAVNYRAGSANKNVYIATSSLAWLQLGITWSVSADQVKAFFNGAQSSSTLTTLGTWAGSLSTTYTNLAALTSSPTQPWNGWLAYALLLNRAATATEIAAAYSLR
jgi:hypothetical protein